MSRTFLGKIFTVNDPDARLRKPGEFMSFLTYAQGEPLPPGAQVGDIKRIPNGTQVRIDDIELQRTGTNGSIVFGHAISTDGATEFGWTSTRNLAGKFINEVLDEIPPAPRASEVGPNAAWSGGKFVGQRTLVEIVDVKLEIERIARDTLDAYLALVSAAAADDVLVAINSGFRSFPE